MAFQIHHNLDADTKALFRQLNRKRLVVPREGQHVDRCHFSKTGWAVWDGNACTCKPAKAPKQ